ncbi:MAG: cytochrome P450 [Woeseiaceae bacterium]|nr:cytochrome P450 [Woeseiaceae bacterium]
MYLEATDRQGTPFTDRELLDELVTLIVAGYETSAGTLNWAWHLLARHPEAADALCIEAAAYGPRLEKAADDPGLAGLIFAQQVLDETLRLYPPVWLYTRRALQDDVVEGIEIPADADIFLAPFIMHRSAAFLQSSRNASSRSVSGRTDRTEGRRSAVLSLSLGPAPLPGRVLSRFWKKMKIHLGMLVQQFRLLPVTDAEPDLDLGINLRSAVDIYLQPEIRTPRT